MTREIINGSLEPLWRHNARRDADRFKLVDVVQAPSSRRAFLGGAGSFLLAEYLAMRRANAGCIAPPVNLGLPPVTNARTGATYPFNPETQRQLMTCNPSPP